MDLEIAETEIWADIEIQDIVLEMARKSPLERNYIGHVESLAVIVALRFEWADDFSWQKLEEICDNLVRNAPMAPLAAAPWQNEIRFGL